MGRLRHGTGLYRVDMGVDMGLDMGVDMGVDVCGDVCVDTGPVCGEWQPVRMAMTMYPRMLLLKPTGDHWMQVCLPCCHAARAAGWGGGEGCIHTAC